MRLIDMAISQSRGSQTFSVPGPLFKSCDIRGPLVLPDLTIRIIVPVCIAIGIEFKLLVSEVDVSHICRHKITTLILDSRCH